MGKSLLYAVVLLWMMPDLSSPEIIYNIKETFSAVFTCHSPGQKMMYEEIKLFLYSGDLQANQPAWFISIPRETIIHEKDITPIEQWFVAISLQDGLYTYITEGTLLDLLREPILQWTLGKAITNEQFHEILPNVVGIRMGKCPCANDVVVIGVICNHNVQGIYLGLTQSGFWNVGGTTWYNLTEYLCSLYEDCQGFSFVDVVLTNHYLLLLTSLGLLVSSDLRYPKDQLTFSRTNFCGFEREDYVKAKLWYTERCFANKEAFEDDFVSVTFEKNLTLSQTSTCFFSRDPFFVWNPCLSKTKIKQSKKKVTHTIVSCLVDNEQKSVVYLFNTKESISVAVRNLHTDLPSPLLKFPVFNFPKDFSIALGMVFHPRSHFLYVYGSQVWLSTDGGNSFVVVAYMTNDPIKQTYHSFYSSKIIFLSMSGRVHLSRAGLRTYTTYGKIKHRISEFYYNQLGTGILITLNKSVSDCIQKYPALSLSALTSIDNNVAFKTALAPQYLTLNEIIFFAYVPLTSPKKEELKFQHVHIGKKIQSRSIGDADIVKIMHHDELIGFPSSAIVHVSNPFKVENKLQSPCLENSITIEKDKDPFYRIHLLLKNKTSSSTFRRSDIEKTVVIPGYSSFLLVQFIDRLNVLALSTMPTIAPFNKTFKEKEWLLYDFSMKFQTMWKISRTPCNYWIELESVTTSRSFIKYIDLANQYTFKIKVIPRQSRDAQLFQLPLLEVFSGSRHMMEMNSFGYWDNTNSYIFEFHVFNRNIIQGMTSISFVVWQASTACDVTTIVLTLKASCSYFKSMQFVPNYNIPKSAWEEGIYANENGFNMIKTLPDNYRPPSNMGIAIPLTDNFYNADPSKPKPRNLFPQSRFTGKYKQCFNKSTRAECNCSIEEKMSYALTFSDCREKVPRHQFPVNHYPISLKIHNENLRNMQMEAPYFVTISEVNNRGSWKVKHYVPDDMKRLKKHVEGLIFRPVYNPKFLNLSITGSELFHFRVTVIPGVTFCDLADEFQIYVDDVPTAFPGKPLIASITAAAVGGTIFFAFLFELYNVQVWTPFKNMFLKLKTAFQIIRNRNRISYS
ncbi:cation channel sperm-associated auxiliary subunit beta isoform X2 [Monodelphis domestica]|uniref:Cation channel sperm associated auxiliary subunit beta n=1 Tax=Monodelphis domestica TaxID=13616 RepID=A0A5F8H1V8_MONDO|nr:cation channel sperm-associated auxiliary subunit beta isoform X2 [Monodelphis domestica]